jgi:hypothetical protein
VARWGDGFRAFEFHLRCDDHANTLTVILDTNGNIFGGFTPVKWESGGSHYKADNSQKSFLFTLKNPHNIPARRFVLKSEEKHKAIWYASTVGPYFGSGSDIGVNDNCNSRYNVTTFGVSYINDTGLEGMIVLAGLQLFKVQELQSKQHFTQIFFL